MAARHNSPSASLDYYEMELNEWRIGKLERTNFPSPQDDLELDSIQSKNIFFAKKNFYSSIHASSDLGWGFDCIATPGDGESEPS